MSESFITNRFKDQVVLITGAASGLGKAIAHRMALEGAHLVLWDYNNTMLEQTATALKSSGASCSWFCCDISRGDQVQEALAFLQRYHNHIDAAIHSAGIVGPTGTPIADFSELDFDNVCRVNLKGSFLFLKHVLKRMLPLKYGRILLIASVAGKEGNPGMAGYNASKAGMIGLVKGAAKEVATTGITINGLAPAVIETSMNTDTAPEQLAYMTAKIPMGRLGRPEEVAALVSFIVSRENSFSTGFIYDISGGRVTY